jgi:hypothetical protein
LISPIKARVKASLILNKKAPQIKFAGLFTDFE